MHFSQKAMLYNRAEFTFGERALGVMIDDGRLKIGFTVPYPEIRTDKSLKSFPERAIPRFGLAIALGALAGLALCNGHPQGLGSAMYIGFLLLGFILVASRRHAKFDATKIPVASGNNILVFRDTQHHVIVDEIYKRRKAEIRRLYATVDTLNHPELEFKKFLWLKETEMITDLEFNDARMKIASESRNPSLPY